MLPRAFCWRFVVSVALGGLCLALCDRASSAPLDVAPAPHTGPSGVDRALLEEIKARSELMKNLAYLSDRIGARLTGSANLERANKWTAEKMKAYGLENVRLEPWEIPYGWERGRAEMKLIEPDTGRSLLIASRGWAPGTKGKITADVVFIKSPRTTDDLKPYKGKLKGAVVMLAEPSKVSPITDTSYGPPPAAKKGERPQGERPPGEGFGFMQELTRFLKDEGIACQVTDAAKPHGLLVTTGNWGADRAAAEQSFPRVFMAHEHYALLHRLVTRENEKTRVELEITNTFIPGPLTVYNTIGEVPGAERPDEIVVVGAHLDSWELASGTTDNGTGSCVVLETARAVALLAKSGMRPKRTIRFCLFSGEEQGLWGSRKYAEKYKADLPKHSVALVHDTGTGKVLGFGTQGRKAIIPILEPQLETLKSFPEWKGLDDRGLRGTDHESFERAGVPGFACRQDMDEYRFTHHTQSDTFDKAKEPNLIQGAQVMAITAVRIANLPDLLPRVK
jgi:hypothetical protein